MKRIMIIFLSLVMIASFASAADKAAPASDQPAKIAVSFNPLGLLVFSFPVSGEYALTKDISVVADVLYSPNIAWVTDISLLAVSAGGRYYFGSLLGEKIPEWLKGPALKGLFGGARLIYDGLTWNYSFGSDTYKGNMSAFGVGAEAGCKYFFKNVKGWYAEGILGFNVAFPATWTWTHNGEKYSWASEPASVYSASGVTYGAKIGYSF
jgi:hypothetical protein